MEGHAFDIHCDKHHTICFSILEQGKINTVSSSRDGNDDYSSWHPPYDIRRNVDGCTSTEWLEIAQLGPSV